MNDPKNVTGYPVSSTANSRHQLYRISHRQNSENRIIVGSSQCSENGVSCEVISQKVLRGNCTNGTGWATFWSIERHVAFRPSTYVHAFR